MQGLNRAYLIGNVTTVEACKDGSLAVEIATPHSRKVDGDWTEEKITHRLVATGKEAAFVAQYAHVGDILAVEAVIIPERTVDRKGDGVYSVRLRLERVLSIAGKNRIEAQA